MKTTSKIMVCLFLCFFLTSCFQVPDPIPDGTWACEEEPLTLLLAGDEGIGLYNGSLVTGGDWSGYFSLDLCPRRDGGQSVEAIGGIYWLNREQTAFVVKSEKTHERYHFTKSHDTSPPLSGTWISDTSPLLLRFNEGTLSLGEDGQGNLTKIRRTLDSPHIWVTRGGEYSMESVLLFGVYELRDDQLICTPYNGDASITFKQTDE